MDKLATYLPIVEFLGKMLGPETEVVLTDLEKIVHVANQFGSNTIVGSPLGKRELDFMSSPSYADTPYIINYRALATTGDRMRSSTMFIREGGELLGLLVINSKVEDLLLLRNITDTLINGYNANLNMAESQKDSPVYDNLAISVEDMVSNVVDTRLAKWGVPADRLTPAEKKDIVQELDQQGAFMVKGSVSIVARRLASSDATIYRYLHQLGNGE